MNLDPRLTMWFNFLGQYSAHFFYNISEMSSLVKLLFVQIFIAHCYVVPLFIQGRRLYLNRKRIVSAYSTGHAFTAQVTLSNCDSQITI